MDGVIRSWQGSVRPRWARLLLLVLLCAAPAAIEAGLLHANGFLATTSLAPQASAVWPYGTFHDLRWVLVYHRSWAGFVLESLAAIGFRALFCTAATALAWPSQVPRPPLARLAARNLVFAAVLGVLLSPWAALGIAASDVSVSTYLLGEVVPVLIMAPVLQRGGIVPGWWRGLPPAATVGLSLLNFATLTAGGALLWLVRGVALLPVAVLAGGVNGLLWERTVHNAVRHETVRWRRVPVAPLVIAVVAGLMFTIGDIAQLGVDKRELNEPIPLATLEAMTPDTPTIYLAGYDTRYDGEPSGKTPPILRFSYQGLDPAGRPLPYRSDATHQSLAASARLLSIQVDQVHRSTGKRVALLAQSEGALVVRYYLVTMPHPEVDKVAMVSAPVRAGRIYYPPPEARTGWGLATGWELRGVFAVLGAAGGLPNSADEKFIRSLMDNAPLFRGNRMLCPVRGVAMLAVLPSADALTVPPLGNAHIPLVEVSGVHGLLIDNPTVRQRLVSFLRGAPAATHLRWDYSILQWVGAAWQAPVLRVPWNPVWSNVGGRSNANFDPQACPPA